MLTDIRYAVPLLAVAINIASLAYLVTAIWRVHGFRHQRLATGTFRPPVTILIPVCGLAPGLYRNLRLFCSQDYPEYQIIVGVRDPTDPAIPVVRHLIAAYPQVDVSLVIDETVIGPNLKVSNLANMYRIAKHPFVAIADSDMRVDRHYASTVVPPLDDARVGLVTCPYSGTPTGGLASLLASMSINEWFLPSVLVSAGLREIRFGLGATIVIRRDLLDRLGGFATLSRHLADDNMLGKLATANGFKVVLSGYVVENIVYEKSLWALFKHELRWARTIRAVEPLGHAFSFLMYGVPLGLIGFAIVDAAFDWERLGLSLLGVAVALRVGMHFAVDRKLGIKPPARSVLLVPLRDILSFLVWCTSFLSRRVDWKDNSFEVSPVGTIELKRGFEA